MSTELALKDVKHPALTGNTAAALREQATDIADRISAPSASLRIKGTKRGNIVVGDDEAEEIQVVVIDFIAKRSFYDKPWREGEPYRPPVCYGFHRNPDQMVPHSNVEEIGGEFQSDSCKDCALNQWKSDPMGGNGKACKERRVMMVLPPDATDEDFWELEIPPTSIKSFDAFVRSVNEAWGVPPVGAVVTVSLDQSVDYPKFVFSNPEPNVNVEAHFERMEAATKMLQAIEYPPAEDEAPVAKPVRKKAAKKRARGR